MQEAVPPRCGSGISGRVFRVRVVRLMPVNRQNLAARGAYHSPTFLNKHRLETTFWERANGSQASCRPKKDGQARLN